MLAEIFLILKSYGYIGIFLINMISSATIIFPLPATPFVFAMGSLLNPFFVGIIGGLGAAIGEFTGYVLGMGSRKVIKKKWKKQIDHVEKMFEKYGGFAVIFIFSVTPLPDDIAGIVAGIFKYPVKKYFIAVLLGKIIMNLVLAYAGFYGISELLKYF
ncbi:MAG: VTT domain-containing protein [Candidatus Aenigmatarchaeota archaeon]